MNINFSFTDAEEVGIRVSDITGKVLLSQDPVSYRNNNVQLDLNSFDNGAYLILFQLDEGIVVRRIVKVD